jgi:hypothetical protein
MALRQADPSARAAAILGILETDGPNIRFIRALAESPRPVRRLVLKWLSLGWSGAPRR